MSDKLCRGCGGTGLDHHLTGREMQFAGLPFYMKHGASTMALRIANRETRARLSYAGPLALVLAEVEKRKREGYELVATPEFGVPYPPKKTWACGWCHGTGKPALSVATLEIAVRGGRS